MRHLQTDVRWGQPCIGYHVQARPDGKSIDKLLRLQQEIAHVLPIDLNLIPEDALHLSVATLVPAQFVVDLPERRWSRIEQGVLDTLKAIPARHDFSIRFTELACTEQAIILLTRNQPVPLSDARRDFCNLLASSGMDYPAYNQAHITIARYGGTASLAEAAFGSVERNDIAVEIGFSPFTLVRERRYPSLHIEAL